jgi:hypothetical protein
MVGDRPDILTPNTASYSSHIHGAEGLWQLTGTFYSQNSELGVVVGTVSTQVEMTATGQLENPDGSPLSEIAFTPVIKSVGIDPGQTVGVGQSIQLVATALDGNGNPVVVSPGSFTFTNVGNTAILSVTPDGMATGEQTGECGVDVAVDGITSPPSNINVSP